jgi:hypothetical protein
MTDLEIQIVEDADWADTAPEVQQHDGQFVAVHRKRVVAFGTDREEVTARAVREANCPEYEIVIAVVNHPGLSEIPH